MSGLPQAIQQQLEEADRIMQQATPPEPPADPAPTAEPPPPTAVVQPVDPQPVVQPAEPSQDAAYWRARFETVQGKYNAEVPRLAQSVQELHQQLAQMRGAVEMQRQQPAPAATPPAPLVTEKDDEKFGSDLIDMVRRVSREERRPIEQSLGQVDRLIRQYAPKLDRVQQVEQKVDGAREAQMYADLAREVSDWEAVNQDRRWLAWLGEYDPVAGKTRQQSLDEASAAFDSRRVAAMFKLFKATITPAQPSPKDQVKSELARQVAPSRSATTAVTPQGERTYTGKDYTYWTDYRRIHDTSKEQLEAMLAEMERALTEGRVKF